MASFWDTIDPYLGPVGYGIDKIRGEDRPFTDYLDPGDLTGQQAGRRVEEAGKQAQAQLQALSQQAWDRQMVGLQRALGSMNNYNDVLSNLYGVQTNYFDPNSAGGVMGLDPNKPHPPPAAPPPIAPSTGPATQTRGGRGAF